MATVFEKTWQPDINRVPADNTTVIGLSRSWVWYMKAFLLGQQGGAASGLWTTYYSCDSTTAGTANDGVDRWGSSYNGANIIRAAAGSAHSWYVLKSPTFTTPAGNMNFYMIIDFSGATDSTALNLIWSKAAPTGGTTTARPTSTDEMVEPASLGTNDNTNGVMHFNGLLATDGNFIFFGSKQGTGFAQSGCFFHVLSEARTTDLYPAVGFYAYVNSVVGPFGHSSSGSDIVHISGLNMLMRHFDGSAVSANCTTLLPSFNLATSPPRTNFNWQAAGTDFTDGTVSDYPIRVVTNDTAKASIRGRLADMLFVMGNKGQGATEPTSGGVASMVVGDLYLPSNAAPIF